MFDRTKRLHKKKTPFKVWPLLISSSTFSFGVHAIFFFLKVKNLHLSRKNETGFFFFPLHASPALILWQCQIHAFQISASSSSSSTNQLSCCALSHASSLCSRLFFFSFAMDFLSFKKFERLFFSPIAYRRISLLFFFSFDSFLINKEILLAQEILYRIDPSLENWTRTGVHFTIHSIWSIIVSE